MKIILKKIKGPNLIIPKNIRKKGNIKTYFKNTSP